MKVVMFESKSLEYLQRKVNEYVGDKNVVNVSITTFGSVYFAASVLIKT